MPNKKATVLDTADESSPCRILKAGQVARGELPAPDLKYTSLATFIVTKLKTFPDSVILIDSREGREWTKHRVLKSSLNFAAYLVKQCQLKAGEVVFIVSQNTDIHAISILGILLAGGVYASAPVHSTEHEIREMVSTIRPKVLIGFDGNYNIIETIGSENPNLKTLLLESISTGINGKAFTVEETFGIQSDVIVNLPIQTGLDSMATLVMSSGTTGKPKAIIKTNRNHLQTIAMLENTDLLGLSPNDVIMSSGFCHITGQRFLFLVVNTGAKLLIRGLGHSREHLFDLLVRYSVTVCFLSPSRLNYLMKNSEKYDKSMLNSLKTLMTGGASLSSETYQAMVDIYNFQYFQNSYGLSECNICLLVPFNKSKDLHNCETVGKVSPGMQMKVIDDNSNSLPAYKKGQLCVKGGMMSPGYLNSDLNSDLFTSDGFFKSGDLGYYDGNGFFYITGRMKFIINVDDICVAPAELENVLLRHSDVENAAVIGVKDRYFGEIPMAFVTLVEGSAVSANTLVNYVDSRVNSYKKLRGGLKILNEMPVTHSDKINYKILMSMVN